MKSKEEWARDFTAFRVINDYLKWWLKGDAEKDAYNYLGLDKTEVKKLTPDHPAIIDFFAFSTYPTLSEVKIARKVLYKHYKLGEFLKDELDEDGKKEKDELDDEDGKKEKTHNFDCRIAVYAFDYRNILPIFIKGELSWGEELEKIIDDLKQEKHNTDIYLLNQDAGCIIEVYRRRGDAWIID